MLANFRCPDKEIIPVQECLAGCRMAEECMTLPTRTLISQERVWSGLASTTQLLNGTMLEYLKLTKPYTIDPDSRAFMLQGTKHHKVLEEMAVELGLPAEIALNVDRDIFDLLEFDSGTITLTDYKLWGSLKVAKALGITKVAMKPDPSGAVYKTTSRWGKAGEPKMVPVFQRVPENVDNWEVEYQLNRYRVMLLDFGVKVTKLQVQATVRDGGLAIAAGRGLDRNIYKIPVRILPDEDVREFFQNKADQLKIALATGWSQPCSDKECWDGVRCARFCDVSSFCPRGAIVNKLDEEIIL